MKKSRLGRPVIALAIVLAVTNIISVGHFVISSKLAYADSGRGNSEGNQGRQLGKAKKEAKSESEEVVEEIKEAAIQEAVEEIKNEVVQEAIEEAKDAVVQEAIEEAKEDIIQEAIEEAKNDVVQEAVEQAQQEVVQQVVEEVQQEVGEQAIQEAVEEVVQETINSANNDVVEQAVNEAQSNVAAAANVAVARDNIPAALYGRVEKLSPQQEVLSNIIEGEMKESPKFKTFMLRRAAFIKETSQIASNTKTSVVAVQQVAMVDKVFKAKIINLADSGSAQISDKDIIKAYIELPENFTQVASNMNDEELANLATASGGELEEITFVDLFGDKGNGLIYAHVPAHNSRLQGQDNSGSPINLEGAEQARKPRRNGDGSIDLVG